MEREKAGQHTGHRSAKMKSSNAWETDSHATVQHTYRHGDAARQSQRRHGSDGAETISKGTYARRIWPDTFLRLALSARRKTESGICAEFSALQRRIRFAGARQFRLRLQPRARSLGRERLRLPRHRRAELRGHFLQQLL